ncbi:MAG: MBL fold metallo-hydrolase [Lentisphaerae bacterium]|nr:MBL fold metallo-hydrolase [Lentisphaerota bacterium]
MKVVMGGSRGSLPVSGADQVRHGGDTFALLAEGRDGTQVLVDAGSGIRNLLPLLRPESTLFFTHTHLDHLAGLPLLTEAWPAAMVFPRGDLAAVLKRVFSPPVWPVELPPTAFPDARPPMEAGGLRLAWMPVSHPDGGWSVRIDEPSTGTSVTVATDTEWGAMSGADRDAFARHAFQTDLLVFDAHYRPEEYEARRGWGHSTWKQAVEAAQQCGARKLWLMHHDPARTDDEIDALAAEAAQAFPGAEAPLAGRREMTLHE